MNTRLIGARTALVSGSSAWILGRILRSPDVRRVLAHPPAWIEHGDLADTVMAIDQAARAFEVSLTASERGNEAPLGAVMPESDPAWTVRRAADFLGLSERRTQELAAQLGGHKIGRQWIFAGPALHHERERRRQRAA